MLPIDNNNIRVIIQERKTTDTNNTLQRLAVVRSFLYTGICMMYFLDVYNKFKNKESQRKQEDAKGE